MRWILSGAPGSPSRLQCCSNRDAAVMASAIMIAFGSACAGPKVVDDPIRIAQVREAISRYEPRVIELFGTRLDRQYEVHILAEDIGAPARTRYPRRDLYFTPSAFQTGLFDRAVAHELVHVHATGVWDALPELI